MANHTAPPGLEYAVRLSPRAETQLREFSPMVSAVVQVRLQRLASRTREAEPSGHAPIQGHLVGKTFRALYEVDHDERAVTVLDVAPRG